MADNPMSDNLTYDAALRLFSDLSTPACSERPSRANSPKRFGRRHRRRLLRRSWSKARTGPACRRRRHPHRSGETALPLPLAGTMLARRLLARTDMVSETGIVLAMTPRSLAGPEGVRWFWPHATAGVIGCWPQAGAWSSLGGSTAGRNNAGEPWWLVEPKGSGGLQPYPRDCSFQDCQLFMRWRARR